MQKACGRHTDSGTWQGLSVAFIKKSHGGTDRDLQPPREPRREGRRFCGYGLNITFIEPIFSLIWMVTDRLTQEQSVREILLSDKG
jgi:hypothetical protein